MYNCEFSFWEKGLKWNCKCTQGTSNREISLGKKNRSCHILIIVFMRKDTCDKHFRVKEAR